MDVISMWPLILAAALGSAGLAGAWWVQRQRTAKPRRSADGAAEEPRRSRRRRSRRDTPAHDEQLDTLAAWEPMATRVLKSGEREAYHVLRRALPDHIVLAQVPVARFVKVPTRNSYSEWLRRVGSLYADLVVCDMSSQVVAVVEVRQGPTVTKDSALKRQQRMDKVLHAARIPVHVWLEGALPGPAVAREAILGAAIQTSGRAGYQDLNVAKRDAAAAAVVASMQSGRDTPPPGLDFDVDAWADDNESGAVESASPQDAQRKEPPPSTWFDDLDTDPGTPEVDEGPMRQEGGFVLEDRPSRPRLVSTTPQAKRA
jgi:hypothetical protein